jgi:hypothetical protein
MFSVLCIVTADTSELASNLRARRSINNMPPYYRIKCDVILLFGLTELKAQIAWMEDVRILAFPAYFF